MVHLKVFVFVLIVLHLELVQNTSDFTAAVVEYYPLQETDIKPEQRLTKNADKYIELLKSVDINKSKLDIVVFPESTLTVNGRIQSREDVFFYTVEIQDKFDDKSLCIRDDALNQTFINKLACAAQDFQTYMVINLSERSKCEENERTKCSKDKWNFYNTNIVFNRKGALIAKYRKYNLFGEYYMNQTSEPDISIFETDFGATFGLFTCFDILFKRPTLELSRKFGVTHFIFPSMWFSELPFLTALQMQQQWSHSVNGFLLASGANNAAVGSGGSGIYQGTAGPLVTDIVLNKESKILISKLPRQNKVTDIDDHDIDRVARALDTFYLKQDDLTSYTSKVVPKFEKELHQTVCHEDKKDKICCKFDVSMEWSEKTLNDRKNHYQYVMVAYSGVRSFSGVYNGGIEICALLACTDESLSSCGRRFSHYDTISWPVTFQSIKIQTVLHQSEDKVQFPNSLLSNLRPLTTNSVSWTKKDVDDVTVEIKYSLLKPQNRLFTFGIYGRDFKRDSLPETDITNLLL